MFIFILISLISHADREKLLRLTSGFCGSISSETAGPNDVKFGMRGVSDTRIMFSYVLKQSMPREKSSHAFLANLIRPRVSSLAPCTNAIFRLVPQLPPRLHAFYHHRAKPPPCLQPPIYSLQSTGIC